MRAVTIRAFGGPEVLQTVETELPEPGPGQVRIRVSAAALNPVDVATRAGVMAEAGAAPGDGLPRLGLGWDVAGTVDALGAGVPVLRPGEDVIGLSTALARPAKTHADFVVLDADAVTAAPDGMDPVHAATLPLNGLSALQGLDLLNLNPGDSLLVTGAAGAVGGYAVQLAVLRGLRVVALAGPDDEAAVRELGTGAFVARGDAPADAVRALVPGGVHGALDTALLGTPALDAVREGGSYVTLVPGTEPHPLRRTRVAAVQVGHHRGQLAQLATLARLGVLTTRVAGTYPLSDVAEAHRRLEKGGTPGRLVLMP